MAVKADEQLAISVHAVCELLAGAELSRDPVVERARVLAFCGSVHVVSPDERFAGRYAQLLRTVQRGGHAVGAMDLLIATAAVVDAAPLVTGNVKEFRRVPGLDLIEY